jgi:hypothetical protein
MESDTVESDTVKSGAPSACLPDSLANPGPAQSSPAGLSRPGPLAAHCLLVGRLLVAGASLLAGRLLVRRFGLRSRLDLGGSACLGLFSLDLFRLGRLSGG